MEERTEAELVNLARAGDADAFCQTSATGDARRHRRGARPGAGASAGVTVREGFDAAITARYSG